MKKILFMSMAATALLASCSQDETVDMPQNSAAIQFKTFVNKSTRGADDDITTALLSSFKVWGLMSKDGATGQPFAGTEVTKSGDNWGYTTPVYWEDGYNYSFVAIAPTTAKGSGSITFNAPSTVGQYGSITFENGDGTTDLIYDIDGTYATTPVSTATQPEAIDFTFNHLLSRVKFAFTNGMDDGSVINVTDVQITNANTKGEAALAESNATWSLAADNSTAALSFGSVLEAESGFNANEQKMTDHKYMIPATSEGQTYTVTFTVTRTHNGVTDTYEHEVELPNTVNLEAGNSYQFSATLNAETIDPDTELYPIVFDVIEVTEWEAPFSNTDLNLNQADGQ